MTSPRCETGYHGLCSGWATYGVPCDCPCHLKAHTATRRVPVAETLTLPYSGQACFTLQS
jgi:hypothetical protein